MKKDWLRRVQAEGNPLIDGKTVTFIWKGDTAPQLLDDLHGWDENPQRLKHLAPDLWAVSFSLAADTYLEYSFHDPRTKKNLRDPFNPRHVSNGLGGTNNFFYMPEAIPSLFTQVKKETVKGIITRHEVNAQILEGRGTRAVYLYYPPTHEVVPLLIVYDGLDYLRLGKINVIVDNLIAQNRIRPIALALLQNGGQRMRFMEYNCSDATISWLRREVLPLTWGKLNLVDERGAFGVLGSSMGGLMSLYTGLRMPETFGRIISQSGVFSFEGLDCSVMDLIRYAQQPKVKIWMDVGKLDILLEENRRVQPILKENGYEVMYCETGGAHNYTTWRNSLREALEAMFGK